MRLWTALLSLRMVLRTTDWHEREGVQNRWFWVVVHDKQPELVAAAARMGRPVEADCEGLVHPVHQRERIAADGRVTPLEPANGYSGLIRLARTHLTVEHIAHELVHAAGVVYRQSVHPQISLGNGCRRNEEALAYIYGDLAASMARLFRDHGLRPIADRGADIRTRQA